MTPDCRSNMQHRYLLNIHANRQFRIGARQAGAALIMRRAGSNTEPAKHLIVLGISSLILTKRTLALERKIVNKSTRYDP